jgi:hypothetical protein
MHYFTKIIGEYRVDKYTGAHLNSTHLQYNTFHNALGSYPDIIIHKPFYIPYSDTGLVGNFIFGNEIFNREMLLMTQNMLSCYASQVLFYDNFRSTPSKSSEQGTPTGTIFWKETIPLTNPQETPDKCLT